jgi:hypothetical protein
MERSFLKQDIKMGNVLIDYFSNYTDVTSIMRSELRAQDSVTYAIFDFDISTMLPQTSRLDECRLPYQESWKGTPGSCPYDTAQGEFDFDPFAWDVCALGMTLCGSFQVRVHCFQYVYCLTSISILPVMRQCWLLC